MYRNPFFPPSLLLSILHANSNAVSWVKFITTCHISSSNNFLLSSLLPLYTNYAARSSGASWHVVSANRGHHRIEHRYLGAEKMTSGLHFGPQFILVREGECWCYVTTREAILWPLRCRKTFDIMPDLPSVARMKLEFGCCARWVRGAVLTDRNTTKGFDRRW